MSTTRRKFLLELSTALIGGQLLTLNLTGCAKAKEQSREVNQLSGVGKKDNTSPATAGGAQKDQSKRSKLAAQRKARVVVACILAFKRDGQVSVSDVRAALQRGVVELTGKESSSSAWKEFFESGDLVGIKVNCLAGARLSTHPQVAYAIADELKWAGVPAKNVLVWDRFNRELERAGYTIRTDSDGVRCFGTDTEGFGYSEELLAVGDVASELSTILTLHTTALVNAPVLKDHGIVGVTCALKNWLGAVHNPNKYHDNRGDPYIADLNLVESIRSKQRLIVCDALEILYHGGPGYKPQYVWRYGRLIVGTDPVAVDLLGLRLIEQQRSRAGLPPLSKENRQPTYLATAADERHRLGATDLSQVEVVEIAV